MGCHASKEQIAKAQEEEEKVLGPPSKGTQATEHAQNLVWMVKFAIEIHLGVPPAILEGDEGLKATQMMTRTVETTAGGTMYYVKVHTAGVKEFPWCFCKIFEPETITTVSPVKLHGFKKMAQEYKLVTF